ncbi:MAG: cell division protein FtsQ/DivIB, partial [Thiobacillus sp.]|nr:cell division protein FtsQ/DivIB [Thiobacillus sp.]
GPEDSSAEVVAAYRRHQAALAPLGMTIDELRLSPRRAWRLRLANGMTLALGREQADARLARFIAVYPRLFGAQPATQDLAAAAPNAPITPATVDLRYPDGFAVRMPDGASPFKPSET